MLGAVISGKVADLIGRRGAMWFLQIFLIMGWLSIIFAKAMIGKERESVSTLQCLRGERCDISQEAAEIKDYIEILRELSKSRILDMFEWRYAHSLIVGVGLMLLVQFGGNGAIAFYASSLFEAAGGSTTVGTTALAIIQIPFAILGVLTIYKFGRRPLLMVTAAVACLGTFLAGFAFLLQDFYQQNELTAILFLSGILLWGCSA